MLEGAEYTASRTAKTKANRKVRKDLDLAGKPVEVHETLPIKFGGSPTDAANKVILDTTVHRSQVSPWWGKLLRDITRTF